MRKNDVQEKIENLGDGEAVKMLNTVAKPFAENGIVEHTLKDDQIQALRRDLRVDPPPLQPTDGRIARLALQVMAQNPDFANEIEEFLIRPDMRVVQVETPVQNLDSPTLLYALRTSINFERDERGRTNARVTSLAPDRHVLQEFVGGLLTRLPSGPPGGPR